MENFRDFLKWARELQEGSIKKQSSKSVSDKEQIKIDETAARRAGYDAASLPFLDRNNNLIIPNQTLTKYRWWQGGQSILETLLELGAGDDVLDRYVSNWRGRLERKRWGN